eukprot:6190887-Pleurochrysis_carterae.AAC.7
MRHPAAVASCSLTTALNIQWIESARAHDSEVARLRESRQSDDARRGSRSCGDERSQRSMSLHEGASNTPADAPVHAAMAQAKSEVRRVVARRKHARPP